MSRAGIRLHVIMLQEFGSKPVPINALWQEQASAKVRAFVDPLARGLRLDSP
jgi:hypothetical protein